MEERSRIYHVEFTQSELSMLFNAVERYAEAKHYEAKKEGKRTIEGKILHTESDILWSLVKKIRDDMYPDEWLDTLMVETDGKQCGFIAGPDATRDLVERLQKKYRKHEKTRKS
jgi:hypothetical protein